jgi:hypothetical protein
MTSSGTAITATDTPSSEGNWHPDNLASMTTMLQTIAAQRPTPSPVAIFDFDNTCIFRDIGQAAFRFQIQHLRYRLSPEELAAILPQGGGELAGRPLAAIRFHLVAAYRDLCRLSRPGNSCGPRISPPIRSLRPCCCGATDMARRSDQFGPRYVLPFMGKMLAGFTTGNCDNWRWKWWNRPGGSP